MGTSNATEETSAEVDCASQDQEAVLRQLLLDDREELKQLVTVGWVRLRGGRWGRSDMVQAVVARHVERNAELDDAAAYCQRQLNSALAEQAVLQERLNLLRVRQ